MSERFSLICAGAVLMGLLWGTTGCVEPEMMLRFDPAADRVVKVAAILPLSGPKKPLGEQMLEGIRFAADELNNGRGVAGKRLELMVYDDGGTGDGAAAAMRKAVDDGAAAAVAGYDSVEARSIVSLAKPLRLPVVLAMATENGLTESSEFVFRNCYTDRQQAEVLAAYLWYWRKLINVSVLVDMNPSAEYSRNLAREFAQYFSDLGGTVVRTLEFNGDSFDAAVNEVVTFGAGAIMVPAEGGLAAKIVNSLRRKGYRGIICGPDSWDSDEFLNNLKTDVLPGMCVYTAFFSAENPSAEFRQFRDAFRKKFFHFPGSAETQSYDALKLLCAAIGDAGDVYRFTTNWQSIKGHQGAAALYTMLPNGELDRTVYINTVRVAPGSPYAEGRLERPIQYSKLELYKDE